MESGNHVGVGRLLDHPPVGNMEQHFNEGIFQAALEISRRRADIVGQMRTALLEDREEDALRFARQLCGLDDEGGRGIVETRRARAINTSPALTTAPEQEA